MNQTITYNVYTRYCKRCKEWFKTTARKGKICSKCNKFNVKKKNSIIERKYDSLKEDMKK